LGRAEDFKKLLKYYGNDIAVLDIVSANLTPIQQKELEMLGLSSWCWTRNAV
jgi:hypothetical protein